LINVDSYTLKGTQDIAVRAIFACWQFLPQGHCAHMAPWCIPNLSFDDVIKNWHTKPASQHSQEVRLLSVRPLSVIVWLKKISGTLTRAALKLWVPLSVVPHTIISVSYYFYCYNTILALCMASCDLRRKTLLFT
jgi:hypothetical protein